MNIQEDYCWQRIQHISKACDNCGGDRKIVDTDWDDYNLKDDNGVYLLVECIDCHTIISCAQNKNLPKWHFYKYLTSKREK